MFLLLSGQTDITDRLSFCSSHLCFPSTEKLPSVVCFLLSCPKTTALNKRECVHLFSVVCVYTGGNKTEYTLGLFYYTYYLCLRFQFQYVSSNVYFLRFSSTFLFPRNLDLTLSNVQIYLLEAD